MNEVPVENSNKTEADFSKKTYKKFFIQKLDKSEKSDCEFRDLLSKSENDELIRQRSSTWDAMPAAAGEQNLLKKKRSQTESEHTINSPSVTSDSASGQTKQPQNFNIGRWTELEHKKFLEAILMYGNEWRQVQKYISSRSSTQARSHAQKFFLRLKKNVKFNEEFGESTLNRAGLSGEENLKENTNNRYDSILKFLTDYSKTSEQEENCTLPDAQSMTNDQRRKLIKIVLNFARNSSDVKALKRSSVFDRKTGKSRKNNYLDYEEDEPELSSQNEVSKEENEFNNKDNFSSKIIPKKKYSHEKLVFKIEKVRKIKKTDNISYCNSTLGFNNIKNQINTSKSQQSSLSISHSCINNNNFYYGINSYNTEISNTSAYPFDSHSNLNFLYNSDLSFRDHLKANENKFSDEKKWNENNSLNSSTCSNSYSPINLQMGKFNISEKQDVQKNVNNLNGTLSLGIYSAYEQPSLINKNNLYDNLKTFFNNTRKNSDIRSVASNLDESRKNSIRETDFLQILKSKVKLNLINLDGEEDLVKNPFSLNFDTESEYFMSTSKTTNHDLCYGESIKVEYENINIIY